MDLETTQTNAAAKLPLLKQGEYEMWRLRIEQYFQIQDYALWEVIENGNSFKPVPRTTQNADGTSTSMIPGAVTTEEKTQKKNDVKARSMLLMALPNEHLLTFNQYKDAKTLFDVIQTRFGGNDATKKTQKTLLNTASPSISNDSFQDSTANLSDATVYAFLANQPNGSQLVHEDIEQIHEDDLEEIDLKWQLTLLSMRARRYYQRTGKKITINGSDTAGYDKSKLYGRRRSDYKHGTYAFSDSEVYNDKTCSNTCLKSFETLKTQLDNLIVEFNKYEFNQATYKRGLASVEEQLVLYKKNEVMFCDQIVVLKRDASFKDSEIIALKSEMEKLKKEKECNQIKIDKFENASNCLDKLIRSQISDNSRKGVGYNDVPPPPTGLFAPSTIDLSNYGLEEFQQPEFKGYRPKASKSVCVDTSNRVKKTLDTPLVEELVSEKEKQTVFPTKIEFGIPPTDDQGYVDSGCSRHMTGNISYLSYFQEFDGGYVTFGGGVRGGKITGKGTLKTDFLKIPRKNNMYSVDMKNIVLKESLTCLVAKATLDESMLWHGRLSHINFKTINKLVKENLVRVLFEGRLLMSICSQAWMEGHVGDEAVHKELGDRMERAATTASSLEAEQDSGIINRTQSMATLNEQSP
ncbi:ribonuclease H-like domain-containing protein [Tanacetum coccineum]